MPTDRPLRINLTDAPRDAPEPDLQLKEQRRPKRIATRHTYIRPPWGVTNDPCAELLTSLRRSKLSTGAATAAHPANNQKFFASFRQKRRPVLFWKKEPKNFYPLRLGVQVKTPDRRCFAPGVLHQPEGGLVEVNGFEPMTPCLQSRCSPS